MLSDRKGPFLVGATDLELFFRETPVLVTGAAGFIGRHLLCRLHRLGARLTALDLEPGERLPGVRWIRADVRDISGANPDGVRAEVVFHLAAVLGVRYAAENPAETVSVNVAGTARVLGLARSLGAARFCLLSSSEVYGEPDTLPITEDAPTRPRSVYGWSKVCVEELLQAYTYGGMQGVVIRPFNVYGPGQRDDFVVSRFIRQAREGRPLTVAGDGTQRRVFTYVDDLVTGMLLAVSRSDRPYGVFNIAGEGDISIAELAQRILPLTGSQAGVVQVPLEALGRHTDAEVRLRIPSIEKARRRGYAPAIDLSEGLRRTLQPEQP